MTMTWFFRAYTAQWSAEKELLVCNISSEVYYADKMDGMHRRAITAEDSCQVSLQFNRATKDKEAAWSKAYQ